MLGFNLALLWMKTLSAGYLIGHLLAEAVLKQLGWFVEAIKVKYQGGPTAIVMLGMAGFIALLAGATFTMEGRRMHGAGHILAGIAAWVVAIRREITLRKELRKLDHSVA